MIRAKFKANFLRCSHCGFISVENPTWLPEAYAQPINPSDTGYLARNLACRDRTRMLIELGLNAGGRFLDFAAGYGVFVRLMRDLGYSFCWSDRHCQNLFACHFEAPLPLTGGYEAITAFEVLEHLVDPVATLTELAQLTPCLIVSTDLVPEPAPRPEDWWYYGLEHGQHVSFYSRTSLEIIAERLQLHLQTNGTNFHVLSKAKFSPTTFRRMDSRLWRALISHFRQRPSLMMADHDEIVGSQSGNQARP